LTAVKTLEWVASVPLLPFLVSVYRSIFLNPFPIIQSVKHRNIFLCMLYVMVLADNQLLHRVQLLYFLWTVHRDAYR